MQAFDMVVIGAGPAGEAAAVTAARLGRRVAVVEKADHPGGAAVNTGTVPSKTLRETAVALAGLRSRELYGVDLSLRRDAGVDDFLRHERAVKAGERSRIRDALARHGVSVFAGTGAFADPHTVNVTAGGTVTPVRGGAIVVAIGSEPVRPFGLPFHHPRVHDSDELLDLTTMPRSIAVVGAGVIGSEYACMFAALGVETHLIDGRDALLPFLDRELAAGLQAAMTGLGVRFVWGECVADCPDPGDAPVRLTFQSGRVLEVDHALICAGRGCRTADLNPAAAGLELAPKGRLAVDAAFRTNVEHIYAVGDVIGFPALASASAEQGRAAARHACGAPVPPTPAIIPAGIYTIPEVSSAGATEEELKKAGTEYVVGRARYADLPRGRIIGDRDGFLKLLFGRDDLKLLGVHVLGEQATDLVHLGLLALNQAAGAELFLGTCFNYPTLGELYRLASEDAAAARTSPP